MERKINVLDKFWKWYVGIGNGGFADFNADPDPDPDVDPDIDPDVDPDPDPDVDPDPDPDPDPNPQTGKDEVDVGGVKYTLDAEGNYVNAAGVAVLDKKGVPFYNRAREYGRKEEEHKQSIADLNAQHLKELATINNRQQQPQDLDDIDENTGLTFRQLQSLDKRNSGNITQILDIVDNRMANSQIANETARLQNDPKFKDFFSNASYKSEMDVELKKLSIQTASMPNIVNQVVQMVRGRHMDEIVKTAEKRGRTNALENRHIVGEVSLGNSSGVNTSGGRRASNKEMKQAANMGVSLASYFEIMDHKNKLNKGKK